MVTNEMNFIYRRVPLPGHQKQRTNETATKRIQNGKTRDMLRGVVSDVSMVIEVGGGGRRKEGVYYSVTLFVTKHRTGIITNG